MDGARQFSVWASALLIATLGLGCKSGNELCTATTSSALSSAPRNGAQMGGMEITSSGISYGEEAVPHAADGGWGAIRIYVILDAPGSGMSSVQRDVLSSTLGAVQASGVLTAFVRFYYADPLTSKDNAGEKVSFVASDISQAKEVLDPYLDGILFVQAGFLGPWGEWHGGDLEGADFGLDADLRTLKTGVVDALKAAFPTLFIQLRYPRDIATYYADDPQISWHNDSILAGEDDGGTFHSSKQTALWPDGNSNTQRQWIRDRNARLNTANAGESSENTPMVDCDALLDYLLEYNIRVYNTVWPSTITHCDAHIKANLFWAGPLGPSTTPPAPPTGTELGCWAEDQRPWQLCDPTGCIDPTRCRRNPDDAVCEMYRAVSCTGSWPPAGYPGEETVPAAPPGGTAGAGGSGSIGGASSTGGSGTSAGGAGGASMGGANASAPPTAGDGPATAEPSAVSMPGAPTSSESVGDGAQASTDFNGACP